MFSPSHNIGIAAAALAFAAVLTPAAHAATPPDAPANLAAGPLIDGAVVTWTAPAGYPSGSLSYDVYLGPTANTLAKITTTTATNAPLSGLASGSTYDVAVLARDTNGDSSALSKPVAFTPSASELVVAHAYGRTDLGRASLTPGTPADAPLGSLPGTGYDATTVVASPNGTRIAYGTGGTGRPTTYGIWVANRDGSGTPKLVASGPDVGSPAWSPDGTALAYAASGSLRLADPAGNATGQVTNGGGLVGPTWIGPRSIVASDLSTSNAPLVEIDTQTGARRAVPNSAGAGFATANPSGTAIAYSDGGATWVTTLAGVRHQVVLPDGSSGATSITWSRDQTRLYVVTGTYGQSAQVWSTLAAGGGTPVQVTNLSPYVPVSVSVVAPDTSPPAVSVTKLPAIATTAAIRLSYSARDAVNRVRSYDVQYTHATTVWQNPAWPVSGGWGTTATSLPVHLIGGIKYCFYVRATDNAGNVSAWSRPVCTTAPLDDRAMHKTAGFTAATGSAFYLGTAYSTTKYGEAVWTTNESPALYLVATTCPTCGSVEILEGNKPVATISLHSATTVNRHVLAIPNTHKAVDFMTRVVSSGKRVIIDGVVFQPK
ncbi:MAG: PD40 domain-containing protein [Frankiaceae bacterium]|nr:PD40 domain-containing protein [Frankiaceae bacterium]MBV9368442.1 PD40 domain-containing protein [Frankiales bacterium]